MALFISAIMREQQRALALDSKHEESKVPVRVRELRTFFRGLFRTLPVPVWILADIPFYASWRACREQVLASQAASCAHVRDACFSRLQLHGAQAFMERALQILEIPDQLQQRVSLGFVCGKAAWKDG